MHFFYFVINNENTKINLFLPYYILNRQRKFVRACSIIEIMPSLGGVQSLKAQQIQEALQIQKGFQAEEAQQVWKAIRVKRKSAPSLGSG